MRTQGILIAVVLALAMWGTPASAITFGEPDGAQHPNVGAIMIEFFEFPACSGTLIHPRVFLTAGHCTNFIEFLLDNGSIEEVRVSFDEEPAVGMFDQFLEVEQVITHPNFDSFLGINTADAHDVGLLVLKKPVEDLEPANLPEGGFLDMLRAAGVLPRAQFTTVGYGASLEWPPPVFIFGSARQVTQSEFRNLRKPLLQLSQVPAPGTDDGGTCFGDSGGPTFWTTPDGTEILVAITSWGDAECIAADMRYRIDVPDSLAFIEEVIDDLL